MAELLKRSCRTVNEVKNVSDQLYAYVSLNSSNMDEFPYLFRWDHLISGSDEGIGPNRMKYLTQIIQIWINADDVYGNCTLM